MVDTKHPDWIESELARIEEVSKRSVHRDAQKPRFATRATFDARKNRIVIELDNGTDFSFPPQLAQGLDNASAPDLKLIELSPLGTGLRWPRLDVDLTVDGLLAGIFGGRNWMRHHTSKAGASKSPAKAAAARANGALGGRPKAKSPTFSDVT